MRCRHCGRPLEDHVRYCGHCGARVRRWTSRRVLAAALAVAAVVACALILRPSAADRLVLALEEGDYAAAIEIYETRLRERPNGPRRAADALVPRLETVTAEYAAGDRDHAAVQRELEAVRTMDIPPLAGALEETALFVSALEDSRAAFAAAGACMAEGDYLGAIGHYRLVIPDDQNYSSAQAGLAEAEPAYCQAVLAEAAALTQAGDYAGAFTALKAGLDTLPDDPDLMEQTAQYEEAFVALSLDLADNLVARGDYDGAIASLRAAIAVLSDHRLRTRLAEVEAAAPVPLADIYLTNRSGWEALEDDTGNLFQLTTNGYIEFYSGGAFDTLSGTIAVTQSGGNIRGEICVYLDDQLALSTGELNRNASPLRLEASIAGGQWVRIVFRQTTGDHTGFLSAEFIEFMVKPAG